LRDAFAISISISVATAFEIVVVKMVVVETIVGALLADLVLVGVGGRLGQELGRTGKRVRGEVGVGKCGGGGDARHRIEHQHMIGQVEGNGISSTFSCLSRLQAADS
jgi:hypothetical protein